MLKIQKLKKYKRHYFKKEKSYQKLSIFVALGKQKRLRVYPNMF